MAGIKKVSFWRSIRSQLCFDLASTSAIRKYPHQRMQIQEQQCLDLRKAWPCYVPEYLSDNPRVD